MDGFVFKSVFLRNFSYKKLTDLLIHRFKDEQFILIGVDTKKALCQLA